MLFFYSGVQREPTLQETSNQMLAALAEVNRLTVPQSTVKEHPSFDEVPYAFWLDPELWDRVPLKKNGKPENCWDYLGQTPDERQAEIDEGLRRHAELVAEIARRNKRQKAKDKAFEGKTECVYHSNCGRCTPCMRRAHDPALFQYGYLNESSTDSSYDSGGYDSGGGASSSDW